MSQECVRNGTVHFGLSVVKHAPLSPRAEPKAEPNGNYQDPISSGSRRETRGKTLWSGAVSLSARQPGLSGLGMTWSLAGESVAGTDP
jgi:hypothetical protein